MSRLLPYGERAVLAEFDDLDEVLAANRAVLAARAAGGIFSAVVDTVPAARTLLLTVADPAELVALRRALPALLRSAGDRPPPDDDVVVEIPVRYDGPDLAEVADLVGLTEAEVVAAHTGTQWRVCFGGFAPGFAYLTGGDPRLEVPRRARPRTRVPAGAVGLAGAFSGIYPRPSPGGWQLIGSTDVLLWDVDRDPPALLTPGSRVRFVRRGAP